MKRLRGVGLAICLGLLPAWPCPALGPHEVLLLVNELSPASVTVAEEFARLRQVPALNVVRLRLDERVAISPAEFERHIWTPANRAMAERRLDGHILAWVYSAGFPVRVETAPPVSVTGLTFVRNRLPSSNAVDRALYGSPLFAGPDRPGNRGFHSQTLDTYQEWLRSEMPLPAMMLGYTGARGNTVEEVLRCLRTGAASDGQSPTGRVFLVKGDDIRAKCREWQFEAAAAELASLERGVVVVVTNRLPATCTDALGVMMGAPEVTWNGSRRFLPGAMADHLTSAAGAFDTTDQTKLSLWVRHGVTATSGTVTEPYSAWVKFPSARLYAHLASGCTTIESFYQSVRCPLQILPVGDPLAAPWRPRGQARLRGLDGYAGRGRLTLTGEVEPARAWSRPSRTLFLLDGKMAGAGRTLELDADSLPAGEHRVRWIAYGSGMVRGQVFVEQAFVVESGK